MRGLLWAVVVVSCTTAVGEAQVRVPRVYGATGRPYGPTQAHYQYQRQYGRPWHGYGGYTAGYAPSATVFVGGYNPGWGGYYAPPIIAAPPIVVSPFAPGLSFYSPGVYGGYGYYGTPDGYWPYPQQSLVQPLPLVPLSDPLGEAWQENLQRWGPDLPPARPDPVTRAVAPSSPEARLRSLRAQQDGDEDLRQQQWLAAYVDYKKAIEFAPDQAEAHFRYGLALVAIQNFDNAAFSFKRALALDPSLPQTGADLATLFGHGSDLARSSILHKLADYVAADVRDPDRLFVFGVMLHFSGDARANEVFEAGYRLAGRGQHFLAFLRPVGQATAPAAKPQPAAEASGIPLPPAPEPSLSAPTPLGPVAPSPLPPTSAPVKPNAPPLEVPLLLPPG
jgi:hypothetical protein